MAPEDHAGYDCDTAKDGSCHRFSGAGRGIGANSPTTPCVSYRIGSIGQDTLMCLWDLTEDLLRPPNVSRTRANTSISMSYCNSASSPPPPSTTNGNALNGIPPSTLLNGPVNGDTAGSLSTTPNNDPVAANAASTGSHHAAPSHAAAKKGDQSIGNHVGYAAENLPGSSAHGDAGSTLAPPGQQHRSSSSSLTQKLSSLTLGHHSKDKSGGDKKEGKEGKSKGVGGDTGADHHHPSSDFNVFGFHGKKKDKHGSSASSRHHPHHPVNNHASQSSLVGGVASAGAKVGAASSQTVCSADNIKVLGTPSCPRLEDLSILEPLICKKIAHERLTALCFREDCLVTASSFQFCNSNCASFLCKIPTFWSRGCSVGNR